VKLANIICGSHLEDIVAYWHVVRYCVLGKVLRKGFLRRNLGIFGELVEEI
jgi:hypothetical protein